MFPKLGGMFIGTPQNYDNIDYQREIAKRDLAVLGLYRGWNQNGKYPVDIVQELKALNPNLFLGNYTIMTEVSDTASNDIELVNKLDECDWWLRDSDGNKIDWSNGAWGSHDVNITSYTVPDVNGNRWSEWLAQKDYEQLYKDIGFDFWYSDNNFYKPRVEADWNIDGVNEIPDDPVIQTKWREGQRLYYDIAKTISGISMMVNADNSLDYAEYKNVLEGAFLEHLIGQEWSIESWGGWFVMMSRYYSVLDNLINPKVVLFEVSGEPDDYKLFRYSFTSCLLNDGYFCYTSTADYSSYDLPAWFDEYDLAGTADTKWLGEAIDPPPLDSWQNGVSMRRFQNGAVLCNPKGNGTQEIAIPAGYKRILGTQDPLINNGEVVTTIILNDSDGIVLKAI